MARRRAWAASPRYTFGIEETSTPAGPGVAGFLPEIVLRPGQRLDRYTLLERLATGGMAEVWLARQSGASDFSRLVAIKRILSHLARDPTFVRMFLHEARLAARLSHPHIAQIFDLGEQGGVHYLALA